MYVCEYVHMCACTKKLEKEYLYVYTLKNPFKCIGYASFLILQFVLATKVKIQDSLCVCVCVCLCVCVCVCV
jgi:hypothetical protein